MSGALAAFQDEFIRALYAEPDAGLPGMALLTSQPGFAVYRNTVIKSCIDALAANYPSVARLAGADWFREVALTHARAHPPGSIRMLDYDEGFPAFIADAAAAADLPYLADVARFDRMWMQSHTAADAIALDADMLARLTPEELSVTVLQPLPSARWAWCPAAPIYTLWSTSREGRAFDDSPLWCGEGVLMVRTDGHVGWQPIDAGTSAFLDACAGGASLTEAAASAVAAQPDIEVGALLSRLLVAGAFATAPTAVQFHPPGAPAPANRTTS